MRNLETLMRVHARGTREDFYKNGSVWSPKWLIENAEGKRLLMAWPVGRDDDRDKIAQTMRGAIKAFGGVRYVFAFEAWFVPPEARPVDVRPMDHPDRRECVILQGEDINGETLGVFYEIKRHPDGKPTLSKAEHTTDFMGRFTDMFAVGPYT